MVIWFDAFNERMEWLRHDVAKISLRRGAQGIVEGFLLTAICGVINETEEIIFVGRPREKKPPACPSCFGPTAMMDSRRV